MQKQSTNLLENITSLNKVLRCHLKFYNRFKEGLILKRVRFLKGALKLHLLVIVAVTSPFSLSADSPAKPVVLMSGSNNLSRICLYENKAYSLGSVIQIGDVYLDCVPEKKIETDGRLMWKRIEAQSKS